MVPDGVALGTLMQWIISTNYSGICLWHSQCGLQKLNFRWDKPSLPLKIGSLGPGSL